MITAEIYGNKVEVHDKYDYDSECACVLCCFRNGIPNAPKPFNKSCGAPCIDFSATAFFKLQK